MTDKVEATQPLPTSDAPRPDAGQTARAQPKSELLKKLLRRGKGATLAELQHATTWQRHSVRAFLSDLRKKGEVLVKEQRKSGETAYRASVRNVAAAAADA